MPNSAKTRREPKKGKNGFSNNKGFTVIELMITIGVLAVLMSLALPSYRAIIEKRHVTSGAEQLAAFLSVAQMEAVKRSENVTVSLGWTDNETWCVGTVIGTTACDCTNTDPDTADCKIDSQVRIIDDSNLNYPGIVDSIDTDGHFIFDPARGLVFDSDVSASYDAAELNLLSDDGTYALKVQVTSTGRVKICSASGDKAVPGYHLCTEDIGGGS